MTEFEFEFAFDFDRTSVGRTTFRIRGARGAIAQVLLTAHERVQRSPLARRSYA